MNDVHARVDDPVKIRKDILTGAVDLNELVKFSRGVSSVRLKKVAKLKKFNAILGHVRRRIKILEKNLPGVDVNRSKTKIENVSVMDSELESIKAKLNKLSS